MVQMIQIITSNASAFVLLLILVLHMNRQSRDSFLVDVRILKIMIQLTMFQCFFDTLVFWIDGKSFPMAREFNYIGNVFYYTFNMMIAYCWPLFTEYKLNSSGMKVKKLAVALGVPLALMTAVVASSPWTGFIFVVSEDNIYSRTSWHFFIPTVLIIFFVSLGTIRIYISRKDKGKYMIFPAFYFVTPVTIATAVQTFHYGISLIFIGIAIGLMGVFLNTQSESAYIDALCGVYNRRYYNDYIRAFVNSKKKFVMTGVLIDMDDFKSINDQFGHTTGDAALIQFSAVLRKSINKIGFAARYGGDEFILLIRRPEAEAKTAIAEIEKELKKINDSGRNRFQLAFSYGITEFDPDQNGGDFLNALDRRMYDMKKTRR